MVRPCRRSLALVLPLLLASPLAVADSGADVVISQFRFRGENGGNDEFIELHNRTGQAVDVSGWLLRGSSSTGTVSTRATLDPETIIPPFGYLLAINTNNSAGPYSQDQTASGDVGFTSGITDAGGVAIVLPNGTIVDMVGTAAGSTFVEGDALPSLGSINSNRGYRRKVGPCGATQDTDDNAADFELVEESTPRNLSMTGPVDALQAAACDYDDACVAGACLDGACAAGQPAPEGTACDDGNICTGAGSCDGEGSCTTGEPLDFDDGNPCTADGCDPVTGEFHDPLLGESCDDGDGCTVADACDAQGECAGVPRECTSPPQTGCFASAGTCDEEEGECVYAPLPENTDCDDGDACTVANHCDGEGACVGSPKECEPPAAVCVDSALRTFTGGSCEEDGSCSFAAADAVCPFGCAAGACLPDPCAGVVCNAPPASCHVETGVCAGGLCSYAFKTAGSACEDGDACTVSDTCDEEGTCQPGTAKVCDDSPSDCRQAVGTCNSSSGECQYAPLEANTACDDGNRCTEGEVCDGDGACVGATIECVAPAASCDDDASVTWTGGACDPQDGECSFTENRTACAFGCDADTGLCLGDPCGGVVCEEPPSECHVATGACEDGDCAYDLLDEGTTCDDEDPCTVADQCDAEGGCIGTPVVCNTPPTATCLDANTSRAFAAVGACTDAECFYEPTDEACSLGCDDDTGRCVGDPCAGIACTTPQGSCFRDVGACVDGSCSYEARPAGDACDDEDPCTVNDACDGAGRCGGTRDSSLPGCGGGEVPGGEDPQVTGGCGDGCSGTGGTGAMALVVLGAALLGRRRRHV